MFVNNLGKVYLFILIIVAVVLGAILWSAGGYKIEDEIPYYVKDILNETARVEIDGVVIDAEVAKTDSARIRGLSGRERLASDRGMLFVFDNPDIYIFNMVNTKIPLDIVWILDDRIVEVVREAQPGEEAIIPAAAANYVLEVYAKVGKNWRIGDGVTITFDK